MCNITCSFPLLPPRPPAHFHWTWFLKLLMTCMKAALRTWRRRSRKNIHLNPFKQVWQEAEQCPNKDKDPEDESLTKNHMQGICVYSSDNIYKEFNEAVQTGRSIYSSIFWFHSLHFWLISDIQTLNNNHHCDITYWRTDVAFTGKVNNIIQFGTFASSCYLKLYSITDEEEVLTPPWNIQDKRRTLFWRVQEIKVT